MAAQSGASRAGRYGSGVSADIQNRAANTLSNTLANKYGELAYTNYATERGRQDAASMGAPALAAADYGDIQQLLNVGKTAEDYQKTALQADIDRFNFEQNKPYQKLSAYLGAAYGAPTGSVSTTTQSGGGKIVCTAMNQAYGFGSALGKLFGYNIQLQCLMLKQLKKVIINYSYQLLHLHLVINKHLLVNLFVKFQNILHVTELLTYGKKCVVKNVTH
jgi:hypothetical protein